MSYSKYDLKMYNNKPIDDKGTLPITFTAEGGFTIQDEHGVICHWNTKEFEEYEDAFATALNMAMVYIQEGADVLRWQLNKTVNSDPNVTVLSASPGIAGLRKVRKQEIDQQKQTELERNTIDLARHIHSVLTGDRLPDALHWYLIENGSTEVIFEPFQKAISLSYSNYTTFNGKPVDCEMLKVELKKRFHNFSFYDVTMSMNLTKMLFRIDGEVFVETMPVYYEEIIKEYKEHLASKEVHPELPPSDRVPFSKRYPRKRS